MTRFAMHSARLACAMTLATLAASSSALAQDDGDAQETLAHQALLESLERSEDAPRFAFTRTAIDNGEQFVARFDPSGGAETAWTLIYPDSPDALSDRMREQLKATMEKDDTDRRLLFGYPLQDAADRREDDPDRPISIGAIWVGEPSDDEDETTAFGIGDVLRLLSEDESRAVFAFAPTATGDDQFDLAGALSGEMTVARDGPVVSRLRYTTTDSFKPNALSRIKHMEITLSYAPIFPGGPLALVSGEGVIRGEALFIDVAQHSGVIHSDFAVVSD